MESNKIESTKEHCSYCFDVLLAHLNKKAIPEYPSTLPNVTCPLFVTWMINVDELRGCIGTFSSKPLDQLLKKYALTSALKDSRFDPINLKEVPNLTCSVSLLVNFENVSDAYDWEIGKHGIEIFFEDHGEEYSATFLPEVAAEENWTQDETLMHLIRKAGYNKHWKNVVKTLKLTRYQSSKYELTYEEYKKMKK